MRSTFWKLMTVITFLFLGVGCSEGAFQTPLEIVDQGKLVEPPDDGGDDESSDDDVGKLPVPVCEVPPTKYQLKAEVVSLEIVSKNSGSFGFDMFKWFKFFKTKFNAVRGRLDVNMDIVDSVEPGTVISHGQGVSQMNKREFSFELGIKEFGFSYNHFSKTPLAKLTKLGLRDAMSDLHGRFQNTSEEWSSVVRYVKHADQGTEVVVAAGTSSNLKLGDKLAFYNLEHLWSGEPCESKLRFSRRTTKFPLGFGEVVQLENNAALVRLDRRSEGANRITLGAEAVVKKLTDENRDLYLPLEITSVKGGEWKVDDGDVVDFTPYLSKQINAEAAKFGFVIQRVVQ